MPVIAPWLTPPNFLGAMEAGASTGLRVRAQAAQEQEAGDRLRLAYDQLAEQERRSAAEMASRHQLASASLALRAQQSDALNAYRQGQLQARAESDQLHRETQDRLASQFERTLADREARESRLGTQFQERENRLSDQFGRRLDYLEERQPERLPPAKNALLQADVAELKGIERKLTSTEPSGGFLGLLGGNKRELKKLSDRAAELRRNIATQYGTGSDVTGPQAVTPEGRVRVKAPSGMTGSVPANRLQEYLDAGYSQVQ